MSNDVWASMRNKIKTKTKRYIAKTPTTGEVEAFKLLQSHGVARLMVGDSHRALYTKVRLGDILRTHNLRDSVAIAVRGNSVIMWDTKTFTSRRMNTEIETEAYREYNTVVSSVWNKGEFSRYRFNILTGGIVNESIQPDTNHIKESGALTRRFMDGEINAIEFSRLEEELNKKYHPEEVQDGG